MQAIITYTRLIRSIYSVPIPTPIPIPKPLPLPIPMTITLPLETQTPTTTTPDTMGAPTNEEQSSQELAIGTHSKPLLDFD